MLAIGADWHMAELGAAVTAHANLPFVAQVAIGRALILWFIGEAILILISLVSVNRLPRSARTHALFALSGAVAAATPLFANAAQWVVQPFLAIVFSALCGALAQAGLWAIVYLLTGVALDWLAGRPPRFETAWEHWRTGFVKGAIYGALFMGLILIAALILSAPGAASLLDERRASCRPPSRRAPLSARANDRRQRRRNAALLRPAQGAPIAIREGPCAGLSSVSASRSLTAPIWRLTMAARAFSRWPRSARSATAASTSPSTQEA